MTTSVTATPAAPSAVALQHFSSLLELETDCWDTHEALARGADFVLLDVRSHELFARGHIAGALSLPHRKIVEHTLAAFPPGTLFVTYCAGPHCNGAVRGAIRLASLGRPVKIMTGGVTGWLDEGFALVATEDPEVEGPPTHLPR